MSVIEKAKELVRLWEKAENKEGIEYEIKWSELLGECGTDIASALLRLVEVVREINKQVDDKFEMTGTLTGQHTGISLESLSKAASLLAELGE